jgi:intracellular sulfur oxidation DsrE/DsrF family protein
VCDNRRMFRRAFLSRFTAATALIPFNAQAGEPASSTPARHEQDQWFDRPAAKHRVVFDTWMADRFGETMGFVGNWIRQNKDAYGLSDADLAVVIVARHGATPFAFNEAIWTKYGKIFAANMSANDRTAHPNPSTNTYASRLETWAKQGVRLAICNVTTRAYTQIIARETGAGEEAVRKELTSNAIGDAHFAPAGVVAVTRAQEYGYALVSVG